MTTQPKTGSTCEPWTLGDGSIWGISPWNARVRIASVTAHSPMNGIDHEAIARLMVAAPKLRDALRGLLVSIDQQEELSNGLQRAIDFAEEVLAEDEQVIANARQS